MTAIGFKRRKYKLLTMAWVNLAFGAIAGVLTGPSIESGVFIIMGCICGVGYELACMIEGIDHDID